MKMRLKVSLAVAALAACVSTWVGAAYPEKPIHLVVGFPPGSQPDIVARLLGHELADSLGAMVVIENVTGAAGNIAADRIAKATADGYTLGLLSQTHMVVNPSLYKLPYDPVKDFAPISQVAVSPNVLVVPASSSLRSVGELVARAKAAPGELTFASSGSGSGTHMAAELFRATAGVDIRHIPYKGVVAAMPDLLAGRVSMMFSPMPVVMPSVRQGKLRALAVTSSRRSSAAGELPTIAESGYRGFEATNWYGLVAPASISPAIVDKLHAAIVAVLGRPVLRDQFSDLGLEVIGNSPAEFAAAIQAELPKWRNVITKSGIKVD